MEKKNIRTAKKKPMTKLRKPSRRSRMAQKEVDDIRNTGVDQSRTAITFGYSDFGDNAERLKNIGKVFPMIFFLVAALLISLTTMTRMVEGTANPDRNHESAGIRKIPLHQVSQLRISGYRGGSIVGVLFGEKVLPFIIIQHMESCTGIWRSHAAGL